jgi:hypothetical protein
MKKTLLISFIHFTFLTSFGQSHNGRVTKQGNFREGPGTYYPVISSQKVGKQIFIISLETENNINNIIDIVTNKKGCNHKSFVKV